ncbi:MAG: CocE/NonD family hydrolase [Promethearchaeota archaeon]|nr:MAG: CocE/NonD family hydrolase [Candidatus Lokiarchaeota archaeon]
MKEDYVTSLSYLKVPIRPRVPKSIWNLIKIFVKYGSVPLAKILGITLGLGYPKNGVKRYPEAFIEMNDGVKLATDIYMPRKIFNNKSKCPTILIRLPYWKDIFSFLGYGYAAYGFVAVIQDIRGTGHSSGFNYYLFTEREDGLQTLQWISKQYWYDGKIGMVGASYFGITQLAISWDNKYLTCISPSITSTLNLWKNNGGLQIHALTTSIYRIMLNIATHREIPQVQTLTKLMYERFLNPKYALFNDSIKKKSQLKLSQLKGKSIKEIQDLLVAYYNVKNFDPSKRSYKVYFNFLNDFLITQGLDKDTHKMSGFLEMNTKYLSQPVFMLAGWQDMFLEKQLEDFLDIKKNAVGDAEKYSKMLIGPWAHAAIGHPESRIRNSGMLEFFKSLINLNWNRYWLVDKKDKFPDLNKPSIKYWVMGKKAWKYTEEWPPKKIRYRQLFIHSKGKANSIKGDGILTFEEPTEELEDIYIFDPMNPVITKGGRNLLILKGAQNQKDAERRSDVLVYSTKPLKEALEITGPVKMLLYASSSAKDTDFMVKLVDVFPRGKALNILDGGIRARFRNGNDTPSLIQPGKVYSYEINLGNTSNYFRKGHRIRIEITSSNFPRFDINSNLGGEGKSGEYVIAEQRVYHSHEFPSHLLIPFLNEQ